MLLASLAYGLHFVGLAVGITPSPDLTKHAQQLLDLSSPAWATTPARLLLCSVVDGQLVYTTVMGDAVPSAPAAQSPAASSPYVPAGCVLIR